MTSTTPNKLAPLFAGGCDLDSWVGSLTVVFRFCPWLVVFTTHTLWSSLPSYLPLLIFMMSYVLSYVWCLFILFECSPVIVWGGLYLVGFLLFLFDGLFPVRFPCSLSFPTRDYPIDYLVIILCHAVWLVLALRIVTTPPVLVNSCFVRRPKNRRCYLLRTDLNLDSRFQISVKSTGSD